MTSLLFRVSFFIQVLRITGQKCHLPTLTMKAVEREGDVIIGGLFPLHFHPQKDTVLTSFTESSSPTYCHSQSSSLSLWFYMYIQTMVFAVEEISQDRNLFHNVTLGFQIFNTCQMVSRALVGTLQFLSGCPKAIPNFRCRHHPPQAGFIGEAGITESRMMARVLGLYKYPQVSYFATGPWTHDGSQFLSFFRSVPSSKLQAHSLARLVIHFAWTWVGLLTTDSEYGEQGMDFVREEIVKKSVCVAFVHILPQSSTVANTMSAANTITNSKARVIVTFCGSEALPLLVQLHDQRVAGRVWLCSEAMSHISVFRDKRILLMLDGSLTVSPHKEQVPGLRDFILQLKPTHSPEDVFTRELWSKVFNCQWNTSSAEGQDGFKQCTGKENLGGGTNTILRMPGFGMTFNVYNAVYAIAHALHHMAQEEPRSKALVNRSQTGTHGFSSWKLLQYLRKVHFKNKVGEEFSFDEYGDPPAVFDVLNTRLYEVVLVGQIAFSPSRAEEWKINDSAIVWTGGGAVIPVSVCTPSCSPGFYQSHHSNNSTCCFVCTPCPEGEISNQTDSSSCSRCLEEQWPDQERTRCVPKRELFLSFHEPLGTSLASASVCGSLLPILVLGLFIAHRETPLVRANSRELSYLLLAGLALSFLCCLLFLGRPTRSACLLRQAAFGLTFAFCLSCLLAKTLLVAAAFRATSPGSYVRLWLNSRTPRAVILSGCLPQFLLCVVWLAVAPPSLERDTRSVPQAISLLCNEGSLVAFWGMLAYLSLLAGLALTGAFLARNLPNAFNEAWLICFSLLGCFGIWLAFVPAFLTARGRYATATEAFAILGSAVALLSGMFLPKCYVLLLHPDLNTKGYLMRRGKDSRI